ncbi:aminodeoxychorismate synthase component I [Clostridium sp. LIBA-8841]|uniref:aminodeoxychorismate synthase component I n=1 Tax=Clostridium sp. LIBA-8841 TaxID=2987530 RepID=UPI002AC5C7ED|nr:aminodeoxychorismate synthase component I [Clostridium sp. LIBA-8841]MDZ5253370.1 aminodeoxychorismate synthase component I [Clostridium sp. LIBA-8841]
MNFKIKEIDNKLESHEVYSLFKDERNSIFLDSSKEESEFSLYSFIGVNPFKKFVSKGDKIYIDEKLSCGDPFVKLDELIKKYKIDYESNIPFLGGAMGYFSYDIGRVSEKMPESAKDDLSIPDSYFLFYDNVIIFDLRNKKTYVTALGIKEDSEKSIKYIEDKIKRGKIEFNIILDKKSEFISNFSREEYIDAVKQVKDYIKEGHTYIANLTQRFQCQYNSNPFDTYISLRSINKAPFSCYLNLEDFQIISSSPERFLKVYNNKVETRPIKGTRPRGINEIEDKKNRKELLNSEKDKSELLMIVDLERNDLSKVCKPFSVKVTELFKLEEYATVFHLVSTVIGELNDDVSSVKCIRECFPGGSITGAPKIRSMEIIEELEGIRRGIYTGAIGYFDLRGNCDFNIVIRTILVKDNKAYFGVGGGITIESDEEMEYEETLDKAKALMRVL